jgi:type II secretory pathway pseudopilin PulG
MRKIFQENKARPNRYAKRCGRGFMMVEVIVVISIITVSMIASMAVAQKSIYVSRQAVDATEATFLLEEGAEAVRILRDNNWTNISGLTAGTNYYPLFTGGTWTLSTTPNTVDIFTRKVVLSNVNRDNGTKDIASVGTNDPGTKLVTVTVSWVEGGTTVTKTLSFYILDIFS